MGIFSAIMDRLRNHAAASMGGTAQASAQQQQQPASAVQGQTQQRAAPAAQQQGAAQPSIQNVDVEAVLTQLASKHGGGGNWRTSIVDLLKLLDIDSSLDSRKKLADELNVHAADAGTAEQNIALHKAVMRKIAENGGKVPDSMKH
jgi:hypothetical protein